MPDRAGLISGQILRHVRRVLRAFRLAGEGAPEVTIDDEMRYHIECEAAMQARRGVPAAEAWRIAHVRFGGVERFKEKSRDVRRMRTVENLAHDAMYALRVLRRNPGFGTAVVLTFSVGIGCTAAIFSLVQGILLRPLPYEQPASLVTVWERNNERGQDRNVVSIATLEAWQQRARSFTSMAGLVPKPLTLDESPAERLKGMAVSPGYFGLLGVRPMLGRDFVAADAQSADAVILSYAFWRTHFGADARVIGRPITIDGRPMVVVGVMGPDFDPPRFGWISDQPLWLPLAATPETRSWGRFLHVVARLAPGTSIVQAQEELDGISKHLSREIPENAGWSGVVRSLSESITGDVRRPILVSFAAVTLLLLMSIVNVANLMIAFLRRRAQELALRSTLGASVSRLAGQQITLCAILGIAGTSVGLALAVVATRTLVRLAPPSVPRLSDVRVDGTVLAVAATITVMTIVVVGIISALRGSGSVVRSLDAPTARISGPVHGARLLAVEVAIGVVLTILASLMVRSLINLQTTPLGFDATSMVTGRVSLPEERYKSDTVQRAFFDAALARIRRIPGVSDASIVTSRPFACCAPLTVATDPASAVSARTSPATEVRFADDSYFATARIPLYLGSSFSRHEPRTGGVHVVVSRSLSRALWGSANPIGNTISLNLFGTTKGRVIGVVEDVRLDDMRAPVRPSAYLSTERFPSSERDIVVRGTGDMPALLAAVRSAIAATDASIPFYMATTMEASIADTLAQDRFITYLLTSFAFVSLLLGVIGTYGVMSGDVTRRRKEIGIRTALGARRMELITLVLGRSLRAALVGAASGLVVALALSRIMSALVYGVSTWDPASFIVVVIALLLVATLATIIPALRATRVSPMEAIRIN